MNCWIHFKIKHYFKLEQCTLSLRNLRVIKEVSYFLLPNGQIEQSYFLILILSWCLLFICFFFYNLFLLALIATRKYILNQKHSHFTIFISYLTIFGQFTAASILSNYIGEIDHFMLNLHFDT